MLNSVELGDLAAAYGWWKKHGDPDAFNEVLQGAVARLSDRSEGAGLAEILHEVWLRIHVRRFDGNEYPDGRPDYVSEKRTRDSWYDGVTKAERIVEDFAREHGILNIRTALAARAHDYAASLSERTEGGEQ